MAATAQVDTKHASYKRMEASWKRCRDVVDGEEAVKAAGEVYLPKLSEQKPHEYNAYKERATFFGATSRTVNGLTGMALSGGVKLKLPDVVAPHAIDVTLDGDSCDSIASRILSQVLEVGRFGVLMDFSETEKRPYWVPVMAEDIINWDTVVREGDTTLTLLVLRETVDTREGFAITSTTQYRVLELDEAGRCVVTVHKAVTKDGKTTFVADAPVMPMRKGQPLPFIPFVCFGPIGVGMTVHKPPLRDLVALNLSHYRSSADLEHGRHFTALPTPVVTGATVTGTLKIGSSEAWVLPAPTAQAKYLEFTGQGLKTLEQALQDKQKQMQVIGGKMLEAQKAGQEAYATVRLRHAGDVSVLQTIANGIAQGLSTLWRWHAWWAAATDNAKDPDITASLSNNLTIEPDVDLNALLIHAQAGKISYETYYANLQRAGVARDGVSAEQERQAILAEGGADPTGALPPVGDPDDDDLDDDKDGE